MAELAESPEQRARKLAEELNLGAMVPEDDFHWEFEPNPQAIKKLLAFGAECERRGRDLEREEWLSGVRSMRNAGGTVG